MILILIVNEIDIDEIDEIVILNEYVILHVTDCVEYRYLVLFWIVVWLCHDHDRGHVRGRYDHDCVLVGGINAILSGIETASETETLIVNVRLILYVNEM